MKTTVPSVQIFGTRNSSATRAAERFFRERRIQVHFVDLKQKPMSPGEIKRFLDQFGGFDKLLDREGKEYAEAGLAYLRLNDSSLMERIGKEPKLLRLPLVRANNKLAIGQDEETWKAMLPAKP
ncbi:MAG: arsenate reductase family protein [Acidobacteriota bacterium]